LILPLRPEVIGDLAGFAAGVLKRGVNLRQTPTTSSPSGSSVGGKTASTRPSARI